MKVLHLIDSLRVGGAQTLLVTYARQATQAGMETVIFSLREKEVTPVTLALDTLDVQITYLPKTSLWNVARFFHLIRLMREGNFDVVHTHLNYANVLGILCSVWLRLPVVVSIHNVLSGRRKNHLSEDFEQFLLRFATRIIAVGENVGVDYRPLFPKTVVTLPNAVNEIPPMTESDRLALRRDLIGNESTHILIAVGRLTEQKGLDDLIEAFAQVHVRFPQVKLILAGDGQLRNKLQAETDARGLQDHLHWLGVRNDVPQLLAASDIYVSAAHWEGLSIALLEAMSAGLVPVITEVGDAAKVVTPGSGFLVSPHKPDQLAAAICTLLENPADIRRMGESARKRIDVGYGAHAWFERLIKIYKDVIDT
jgi:glycosyltransferase involved in cell wall biosynthesis